MRPTVNTEPQFPAVVISQCKSKPFKDPNWDHIIVCWNGLYNGYEIDTDIEGLYLNNIPDYTHIKPCK